jgi:hypothetical protein
MQDLLENLSHQIWFLAVALTALVSRYAITMSRSNSPGYTASKPHHAIELLFQPLVHTPVITVKLRPRS